MLNKIKSITILGNIHFRKLNGIIRISNLKNSKKSTYLIFPFFGTKLINFPQLFYGISKDLQIWFRFRKGRENVKKLGLNFVIE